MTFLTAYNAAKTNSASLVPLDSCLVHSDNVLIIALLTVPLLILPTHASIAPQDSSSSTQIPAFLAQSLIAPHAAQTTIAQFASQDIPLTPTELLAPSTATSAFALNAQHPTCAATVVVLLTMETEIKLPSCKDSASLVQMLTVSSAMATTHAWPVKITPLQLILQDNALFVEQIAPLALTLNSVSLASLISTQLLMEPVWEIVM